MHQKLFYCLLLIASPVQMSMAKEGKSQRCSCITTLNKYTFIEINYWNWQRPISDKYRSYTATLHVINGNNLLSSGLVCINNDDNNNGYLPTKHSKDSLLSSGLSCFSNDAWIGDWKIAKDISFQDAYWQMCDLFHILQIGHIYY